ncbi:MAG: hypothetical protein ACOZE5_18205 [Verrucomicrobiota bacterium]
MNDAQRQQIDTAHIQKYPDSCPGSTIEMLLKLNGAAMPDLYRYQNEDPGGALGVGKYVDQSLEGGWRLRRIVPPADWAFPLNEIKAKVAADEVVAVFENPKVGKAHGWLVDEIRMEAAGEKEVVLRSKYSEDGSGSGKVTALKTSKVADLCNHRWSDPIFLEKP